ncbi:MAG: bifunctional glutamate N-acetyltransferase/amino-acid acetyltransferase ArgJ [Anaerolineae bacterium]|nr:MAG: bifunctional glutamate N-acetyltransferase/amino-acid acetyltransferase ArgJ [Anaerolineae bacterium]
MKILADGGVTSPQGFEAAASACGLKPSGAPDLALVVSERDCSGAGVFTRNSLPAAPVTLDRVTLKRNSDRLRGVVANSGNANACTGLAGLEAAQEMQRLTAESLSCVADQVLVLSTGVIGVQLDVAKVGRGIRQSVAGLAAENGSAAAEAIMTTDTRPKQVAVSVELPGGTVTIGGMAKGSGMIHPDMATMLAVLTTDAQVAAPVLQRLLRSAVERSFNRISVDGDTSTNDSVLLLANGASGVELEEQADLAPFTEALDRVCLTLAQAIVRDGEGATKFVTLSVVGAPEEKAAVWIARTIATSPLVKTALAGGDPNWGRVLAAAGRAGIGLDPSRLGLWIGSDGEDELQLVRAGEAADWEEAAAASILAQPEITLRLDLGQGEASATVWTCDLTHEYVTINTDYRT